MVPEGWKSVAIGNYIDLLNGFAFKSEKYTEDDDSIYLLRGDNIEPGGMRWRDVKKWKKCELDGLEKYLLNEGDIVIAMDRTWISRGLKVAEVKKTDVPSLLVQRVARVRAKDGFEGGLLKHYFRSHRFEQYVKSVQTETAVPHISAKQINEFQVLLPPLSEQKKIARILSTWDAAIEKVEKLIENSRRQKKALMQQLLTGKKRLPGFSGEWKKGTLEDGIKLVSGQHIEAKKVNSDGIGMPYLTGPADFPNGSIIVSKYTDSPQKCCRPGDILITVKGSGTGKIVLSDGSYCISRQLMAVRPQNLDGMFLLYVLQSSIQKYEAAASGLIPGISRGDILDSQFLLPSIEEQRIIGSILRNNDELIIQKERMLANLHNQKQALMQQLLTGKRRVKVDE